MAPDNGGTQGLALTNFPKGCGGTFDKEVPHLLCTSTLQDEVQRTLALGGAKGEDDPIIVAACNVCGQSEMYPICEEKRSLTHRQALC